MSHSDQRNLFVELLNERGVMGVHALSDEFSDDEIEGAIAVVGRWDQASSKSTGLLVHMLRQRDFPKATGTLTVVTAPAAAGPSEALLRSMRGVLGSPDGMDRATAREIYGEYLERRNRRAMEGKRRKGHDGRPGPLVERLAMTADQLIDAAMGTHWQSTAVHPARDVKNPNQARDYERWVASGSKTP